MWLNPVMLWGLLAVGIPIILHILNFFRQRRQPWAAMALLLEALEARNVQVKMEDRLLLLLRCLALIFLALAFARPVWHGESVGGGEGSPALVLIDASYSMEHGAGVTRFDAARAKAREVLDTIPAGTPITVALMGRRLTGVEGQVLCRNQAFDPDAVRARLDAATPLDEPLDLAGCVDELDALMRDLPASARRELFIVTDAQRRDWDDPSPAWRQAMENLERAAVKVFVVPAGSTARENVAMVDFRLAGGELRRGGLARYEAVLRNYGERPRANVPVTLSLNGVKIAEAVAPDVPARGGEANVSLAVRFPEAGVQRVTAAVAPDELARDDERALVAYVRAADGVLVVIDPGDDQGGLFLRTALDAARASGPDAAPLDIRATTPDGLRDAPLENVDVVFVSDVDTLPAQARERLAAFVRNGGGVALFPGQNTVPAEWNAWTGPDGPLLPAELGEPVERGEGPDRTFFVPGDENRPTAEGEPDAWTARLGDAGHPLALAIATLPQELVREWRVYRRFPLTVREAAEGAAAPALWLAADAGMDAPTPWAVAGRYGRGRVVLFGLPPDRRWSNWPITAIFPILVDRTLGWLGQRDFERPRLVRDVVTLDLPEPRFSARASVTGPRELKATVDLERGARGLTMRFDGAGRAGFYEIMPTRESGGAFAKAVDADPPVVFAVNVAADTGEPDVRVMDDDELRERLSGWPVRVLPRVADNVGGAIKTDRTGRELAPWLLILAAATFLAESILAFRFGRRI